MEYYTDSDVTAKPRTPPRVIIGGGSITGLSLALMLEKVGIDFVLLEAHESVAPEVGAGIVCNSNGFRVLDQLGAYDDIMKAATAPVQELNNWWPDGKLHSKNKDFSGVLERVIGYPMVVLDRQELLGILYSHIQDKAKVKTGARVKSVDEDGSGVHVTVDDGRRFTGDILVGADGVHSDIRDAMWRLGREKAPGSFSDNEIDHIKCNWITLFGISTLRDPRITSGSANTTFNHGTSFGILSGGTDKRYFFLNKALPEELKGYDIPRYKDIDRDNMVREYWDHVIQDDIKFGDLYESNTRAVLVPLEGYVFPRWHFGRIITLGDAAHKLHVVTGQGAMMCIEDGVVFVNQLLRKLREKSPSPLDATQITEVFAETQKLRESRSRSLMSESFLTQSLHAWKNPLLKFAAVHLVPRLGIDFVVAQFLNSVRTAPCLDALPKPERTSFVGFDDEHPEPQSAVRWMLKCVAYLALILCAVWASVSAWSPRPADGLFRLDMSGTLIIMLVEGWRRTNKLSLLQWPLIWALLADLVGFQYVAPFFYLINFWIESNRGRMQFTALSRPVILPAVKVIFPAVFLFYLLPATLTALIGHSGMISGLEWATGVSLWPTATCTASITLIASLIPGEQDTLFGEKYLGYLRVGYKFMFAVLALLHLVNMGWQIKNDGLLVALPAHVAEVIWLLAVYSEVHHYHQLRQHLILHLALIVLAFLIAGPGATAVGLWYWREEMNKRGQEKVQHQMV